MKFVKKLTALFLAIVMTMAMGMTTFAAGDATAVKGQTYTLTITNAVAGHTYKAYQLLKGDVAHLDDADENKTSATLSNIEKGADAAAITSKTDAEVAQAIIDAVSGKEGGALSDAAYGFIDSTKGTAFTLTEGSTESSLTVEAGYYIIVDEYVSSLGTEKVVYSRNAVQVVGPTSVAIKQTDIPTLDKEITNTGATAPDNANKNTNTAAIGDVINFKVTGSVPNTEGYDKYYYVVNDTLSKGFDLNGYTPAVKNEAGEVTTAASIDKTKFTVKIGDTVIDADDNWDVYVDENDNGTTTFRLAFTNFKGLVTKTDSYNGYAVDTAITVEYSATLNSDAEIGTTANTNTVNLIYSNDPNVKGWPNKEGEPGTPGDGDEPGSHKPTGETPDEVTKTYVTELDLTKVDKDTNVYDAALAGAEFTLYGENLTAVKFTAGTFYVLDDNGTYWELNDGTYTDVDPNGEDVDKSVYKNIDAKYSKKSTIVSAATGTGADKKVVGTIDDQGHLCFTGLNAGEYTLKETKTPAGYNTITPIQFTINATLSGSTDTAGGDVAWTVTGGLDSTLAENPTASISGGKIVADIANAKGSILPSTGGMGTTVIYIAGIAMIVAAGVVVIARKRMA